MSENKAYIFSEEVLKDISHVQMRLTTVKELIKKLPESNLEPMPIGYQLGIINSELQSIYGDLTDIYGDIRNGSQQ